VNCPNCGAPLPNHVDRCPNCFCDVGAPNVRAARGAVEQAALTRRLADALAYAASVGAGEVLERFRAAVRDSRAVICRPLAQVKELTSGDGVLYLTFHQLVHAGLRSPEDNEFDRHREKVDSDLFPY
jgi:hypothetical protein